MEMRRSLEFLPFHQPKVPIEERLVRSLNPNKEFPRTPRGILIVHRLIQQRGLFPGDYQLFFIEGEGILLTKDVHEPVEVTSGFVVTKDLKHFNFLMDRDEATREITFTAWNEIRFDPSWENDPEYNKALKKLS